MVDINGIGLLPHHDCGLQTMAPDLNPQLHRRPGGQATAGGKFVWGNLGGLFEFDVGLIVFTIRSCSGVYTSVSMTFLIRMQSLTD